MKLLNGIYYTLKELPEICWMLFVKNYNMTRERRKEIEAENLAELRIIENEKKLCEMKSTGTRKSEYESPF